jgi:hypothetical protein
MKSEKLPRSINFLTTGQAEQDEELIKKLWTKRKK